MNFEIFFFLAEDEEISRTQVSEEERSGTVSTRGWFRFVRREECGLCGRKQQMSVSAGVGMGLI